MALSEQEQKRLEQLEASLMANDPKFADTLRGTTQFRVQRQRAALAGLAFVIGLTALIVGVRIHPLISIAGFVVMLVAAIIGVSSWSRVEGQSPTTASAKKPTPDKGEDFMAKLEERWRKRQQGGDL